MVRAAIARRRHSLLPLQSLVSIGPILAMPGMRDLVQAARAPRVAISPIIGGRHCVGQRTVCWPGWATRCRRWASPDSTPICWMAWSSTGGCRAGRTHLATSCICASIVTDTIMRIRRRSPAARARDVAICPAGLLRRRSHYEAGGHRSAEQSRAGEDTSFECTGCRGPSGALALAGEACPERLHQAHIADIGVVSPDDEILCWAAQSGAQPVRQVGSGLNDALELGRQWAFSQHAEALMVVLGDLPLLTRDDVLAMAAYGERADDRPTVPSVTIAPRSRGKRYQYTAVASANCDSLRFWRSKPGPAYRAGPRGRYRAAHCEHSRGSIRRGYARRPGELFARGLWRPSATYPHPWTARGIGEASRQRQRCA